MTWLVVAGEPSGDRMAAAAVRALHPGHGGAFGIGGPACSAAGMDLVADMGELAAMGALDVAARAPAFARAAISLLARVRRDRPSAALLVGTTELSARLGPWLRRGGTRVLWCGAPQVWAWRPERTRSLAGAMDRLAVLLPFEEALWREAGVDATYIGHPAVELTSYPRSAARADCRIDNGSRAAAVLPGSRAGEIARLAEPLCAAAALLIRRRSIDTARVLEAPGLTKRARAELSTIAERHGLELVPTNPETGAGPLLRAFDLALCASGTASLEAALAGAPPVIAYRLDPIAYAIARRLVTAEHVGLPNVLLGRRAFPELLQDQVTPEAIARAADTLLAVPDRGCELAAELLRILKPPASAGDEVPFGERLAGLLEGH